MKTYNIKKIVLGCAICIGTAAIAITVIIFFAFGIVVLIPSIISGIFILLLIFHAIFCVWKDWGNELEDNLEDQTPWNNKPIEEPVVNNAFNNTATSAKQLEKEQDTRPLDSKEQPISPNDKTNQVQSTSALKPKPDTEIAVPQKEHSVPDMQHNLKDKIICLYENGKLTDDLRNLEKGLILREDLTSKMMDNWPSGSFLIATSSSQYLFRLFDDFLVPKEFLCGRKYDELKKEMNAGRFNLIFDKNIENPSGNMVLVKVIPAKVRQTESQDDKIAQYEVIEKGIFYFK